MKIKNMSLDELYTNYAKIVALRQNILDSIAYFEEFTTVNSIMTKEIAHMIEREVGVRTIKSNAEKQGVDDDTG